MKKKLIALLSLFIVVNSIQAQDAVLEKNLKTHLEVLADDNMQGRLTGTKYEQKAGKYIADQFKKYNLKPKGDKGDWYQ
ncbi:MAG: hypothetical protein NTX03_00560, partial [Bacteroidetes bacterium]|nr:hypothetical protein [Bacteroidota bacterium]